MAVLPTPGSPISTGLFLVRRDEHLDGAADLLVPPDHRVELALARHGGQVAGIFLEGVVACSALALSAVRPLRRSLIASFSFWA